jgi:hypothetical protein
MPYRRLPNTDQARVRALSTALEESDRQHLQLVISYQTQHEAKVLLQKFEQAIGLYKQTYDNQVNSNKDFQQIFRNARLYISHFIQVLNLAVQRNEIKKEYKKLYGLDSEDFTVPDMVSAESLIEWGQNIIEGEASRMKAGGVPLYNPAIAKVKVHYDIFKEYRDNQLFLQQNTARYGDKVNALRQPVDDLILDIWNQIEGFFGECPPYTRMESCKQFGVIYYYRRGEAELTPADDLPKPIEVEEVAPVVELVAEPVVAIVPEEIVLESVEVAEEEIPVIEAIVEPAMEVVSVEEISEPTIVVDEVVPVIEMDAELVVAIVPEEVVLESVEVAEEEISVIEAVAEPAMEIVSEEVITDPIVMVEEVPAAIEAVVEPVVEAIQEEEILEPVVAIEETILPVAVVEESLPVVEAETTVIDNVDIPVEIVLETITEPEMMAEEISPVLQQDVAEVTLFDDFDVKFEVSQEEPELKLNGVIPKKRKKRNVKQDELLSLFFQ